MRDDSLSIRLVCEMKQISSTPLQDESFCSWKIHQSAEWPLFTSAHLLMNSTKEMCCLLAIFSSVKTKVMCVFNPPQALKDSLLKPEFIYINMKISVVKLGPKYSEEKSLTENHKRSVWDKTDVTLEVSEHPVKGELFLDPGPAPASSLIEDVVLIDAGNIKSLQTASLKMEGWNEPGLLNELQPRCLCRHELCYWFPSLWQREVSGGDLWGA